MVARREESEADEKRRTSSLVGLGLLLLLLRGR